MVFRRRRRHVVDVDVGRLDRREQLVGLTEYDTLVFTRHDLKVSSLESRYNGTSLPFDFERRLPHCLMSMARSRSLTTVAVSGATEEVTVQPLSPTVLQL